MICNHCLKDQPETNFILDRGYRRKQCKACRAKKLTEYRRKKGQKRVQTGGQKCELCPKRTTAKDGVCTDCSLDAVRWLKAQNLPHCTEDQRRQEFALDLDAYNNCVCPVGFRVRMRKAAACYDSTSL